jgi:ABC-type iron transport system FetAB ATPase subunit
MFTGSYACPHNAKIFLTKVTLLPVHSTNLTHTETCSCVDTSVAINKHIVKEIIEVLILYGRQNIAILWHNKDKSNSMAILPHVSMKYYSITWITQSLIR